MIKGDLQKKIQAICTELGITREVVLEHPQELTHGDFATSIALAASKDLKINPKELAETIAQKISELQDEAIESVSVAGPGFINVTLTKKALYAELIKIIDAKETYGKNEIYKDKKILIEHSSPNLFKPFHIGHLMNNTIGEAMTRIMRNTGANVYTMSFPSDVSLGIAKAVYILTTKIGQWQNIYNSNDIYESIKFLGDCYVEGVKYFEDNPEEIEKAKTINRVMNYVESDSAIIAVPGQEPVFIIDLHNQVRSINEKYFRNILSSELDSQINEFVFESVAGNVGGVMVESNIENSIFQKSDENEKTIIYVPDENRKDINTSVFINSDGIPTYDAKDLGLLKIKFQGLNKEKGGFVPSLSIFVTDSEQVPHFKVVFAAASEIEQENFKGADYVNKSRHVPHGRMTLKGAKMSSRLGGVPLAEETIKMVAEEAQEKALQKKMELTEEEKEITYKQIALAALKFTILKAAPGKNIDFDPDTALSFEGDSGPYVQYTYVRTRALIEKGADVGITPVFNNQFVGSNLERILYRFEEATQRAAQEYAPHSIAQYLLEVAQTFNSWYGQEKVIDETNKELSAHRLAVSCATGIVLKNGLYLLGINTPERM